jgi:hypothetical protein
MTQRLAETLNLASISKEESAQVTDFISENKTVIDDVDAAISKIDAALPLVRDLDAGDEELDELANLAKEKFEDMCDLGLNVEPRFSGIILQTASTLLGHAIAAKTAKMDKKLKMIGLQLQKAKLDQQIKKESAKAGDDGGSGAIDGEGIILDRNEILDRILGNREQK